MALVTQQIDQLTGGVSQAPASRRLKEQLAALTNGWMERIRGLGKRPSSDHVARLVTDASDYGSAFIHQINRGSDERFRVVIINGDLKVFDEDGAEVTVTFLHSKNYLSATTPKTAFRAVTVGDETYIVNKTDTVQKSSDSTMRSSARVNEGLLWIREGDFLTNYLCTVVAPDGTEYSCNFTTAKGTTTDDRGEYDAKTIASRIYDQMVGDGTGQADLTSNGFQVTLYDTVIHIKRTDGAEFGLLTGEGIEGTLKEKLRKAAYLSYEWRQLVRQNLAENAAKNIYLGVWDQVDRMEDLPPRASEGFRVEVVGDASTEYDNYWFMYTNGTWVECVAPGEIVAFDAASMPHVLLRSTLTYEDLVAINGPSPSVLTAEEAGTAVEETTFTESQNDAGSAINASNPMTTTGLSLPNQTVYGFTNLEGADGVETVYTVEFTFDARNLAADGQGFFSVEYNDGVGSTNWSAGNTRYFQRADGLQTGLTMQFTATLSANYDLRFTLDSNLDGEDINYAEAYPTKVSFTAQASNNAVTIDLDAGKIYPLGTTVTATVNANPNVYTVTGDDETAEEVAIGLELLIEDDTNITSSVSGATIEVTHTTTTPTVTIATSYDSSKHVILSRDHGFDDDELVGETIDNLTDGSSGVITANTGRTITASAGLSTGDDNTFEFGDRIKIETSTSTFTWQQVNWDLRAAGDEQINPWPSFVGKKIDEICFHGGRLGFIHDESIVLSRAGERHNFFRKSARQILDGDPIDIDYAGRGSQLIHSAVEMNTKLILFSEVGQLLLDYGDSLTPRTAGLKPLTHYENSGLVRPIPYGANTMFLQVDGGAVQVHSMKWNEEERPLADELGPHVPTYIQGNPIAWAVSSQHKSVFVLTDDDQSVLYAGKITQSRDDVSAAWCKWQFGTNDSIIGIDVLDDVLGLVVSRDEGVFLEQINISENFQSDLYIDRKMDQADMTTTEWITGEKYNEPFNQADDTDITDASVGYTAASAGFIEVKNNRLSPIWAGIFQIEVGYPYVGAGGGAEDLIETTGVYEMYADIKRGATGTGAAILFNADDEGTNNCERHLYCLVQAIDASNCRIQCGRIVDGGSFDVDNLTLTLALAQDEWIRIVVKMEPATGTFTVYTEPQGGGTRTLVDTWDAYTGTMHSDGNHKQIGVAFTGQGNAGNTSWEIDNINLTRTDVSDATLITLPFDIPSGDGTLVVVNKNDLTSYSFTRPNDNEVSIVGTDLTSTDYWIGWTFSFSATLSEIFNRHWRTNLPLTGGKLQILTVLLEYADTIDATITVARTQPSGNYAYTVAESTASNGEKRVPVGTYSDNYTITVSSSTIRPLFLQALTWEGDWVERARRL